MFFLHKNGYQKGNLAFQKCANSAKPKTLKPHIGKGIFFHLANILFIGQSTDCLDFEQHTQSIQSS